MRAKVILFALSACFAFGQDVTRVFQLHHIENLNQFATVVRTIARVPNVASDEEKNTLSVIGAASQIAIAEWLFTEFDRTAVPDSVTQEFRVSNNADDVVRVFYLPNTATVQNFYEVLTTIRTISDIRLVCGYDSSRAVAVRGTADQIAATDFLAKELDQPAAATRTDSRIYQIPDTGIHPEPAIRVFYLPYTATVQQFQEVATLVRTIGDVRRCFTYNAPKALVVRGTPDQVALVGWLVQQLGQPVTAAATASPVYTYPDPAPQPETAVRIFYVKDVATVPAFQQLATQIRTATKLRRVFTYNATMALALRGTVDQIALAQQMLQDRQVAAK